MYPKNLLNLYGFSSTNPFAELERMRRQMDALSGRFFRSIPEGRVLSAGVFPLLNLTENQDNYYIRAELPGLRAEDLNIHIVDKTLTISGERNIREEGEKSMYHRREREAGKFSRAIGLPGAIDRDKVEAQMRDGLLTITIPKSDAVKPKQITVR
jgi:HSP20 family protein